MEGGRERGGGGGGSGLNTRVDPEKTVELVTGTSLLYVYHKKCSADNDKAYCAMDKFHLFAAIVPLKFYQSDVSST